MKSLLAVSLLIASVSGFASTCFKAVDAISKKSQLPEVVCVDSYNVDLVVPELPASPYYQATVVTDLGTLVRDNLYFRGNKDTYTVETEKNFVREGGACERSYSSAISFKIELNKNAKVIENSLSVEGVIATSPDSCHADERITKVRYEQI